MVLRARRPYAGGGRRATAGRSCLETVARGGADEAAAARRAWAAALPKGAEPLPRPFLPGLKRPAIERGAGLFAAFLAAVEAMKQEAEKIEQVEPVAEPAREPLDAASGDFTAENRANMWDAIRTPEPEEDLDVPPTLRERLRGKKGNKGA